VRARPFTDFNKGKPLKSIGKRERLQEECEPETSARRLDWENDQPKRNGRGWKAAPVHSKRVGFDQSP
jgi:hypothetical protein